LAFTAYRAFHSPLESSKYILIFFYQ
jgi:hypothetical protein